MRGGFRARAEARSAGAVRGSRRAAFTHFHHIIDATSLFGWAFKLLADSSPEPACEVVSPRTHGSGASKKAWYPGLVEGLLVQT